MLKKILKYLRKKLLQVDWIKREVEAYKQEQEKRRYHQQWAHRMSTGYTIRNLKPVKYPPYDTLEVTTREEYYGGRVISRETRIVDSVNWGVCKTEE